MIATSAAFRAAIRSSHQIATRSVLLAAPGTEGVIGGAVTGTDLQVIGGSVTLDSTAAIRGTLDLQVAAYWPQSIGTNQILPYGSEMAVARGITYGSLSTELVQLGIFRIDEVEEVGRGQIQVTAYDRMKLIQDARLLFPVQFDGTFTFGTAVAALVHQCLPGATITWDDPVTRDTSLGRSIAEPTDRLAVLNQIVTAAGKVCYFNNLGKLVVVTPPTANAASVWQANAGRGGILVSTDRRITRQGVYNAVIASSSAIDSTAPVSGYALDNNPASPTYFFGPFGQVPEYFSSPLLTTTAQCQQAARSLLAQKLGLPYSVDLTAVPDPSLEPLDAITVTYPPDMGVATGQLVETHIIDSLQIPLGVSGGALTCHTRLQVAYQAATGTTFGS